MTSLASVLDNFALDELSYLRTEGERVTTLEHEIGQARQLYIASINACDLPPGSKVHLLNLIAQWGDLQHRAGQVEECARHYGLSLGLS